MLTICGRKNKLRMYYLAYLKSKIIRDDEAAKYVSASYNPTRVEIMKHVVT